jgi:hypothetical protein
MARGILIMLATFIMLFGLLFGVSRCVDIANAGELVQHSRSFETYYDEGTSVFCATRANAVSCVYVPRDTVRR